jgi:hypothetical protein
MIEQLLEDPKERALHRGTLHQIAAESGLSDDKIEPLYEQVLGRLLRTARVKDFLPVLTGRLVKESLRTEQPRAARDY